MPVTTNHSNQYNFSRETIDFFTDEDNWFNKLYPKLSFVNYVREQILKLQEDNKLTIAVEMFCKDNTVRETYIFYLDAAKTKQVRIDIKGCLPFAFHKSTILEPKTLIQFNNFVFLVQQHLPAALAQAMLYFFVAIQKRADSEFFLDTHHESNENVLTFEAIGCKQNIEFAVSY